MAFRKGKVVIELFRYERMLRTGLIPLFLLPLVASVFGQREGELQEIDGFGSNPGGLKMYLHVPDSLPPSSKVPLVVALHGCTQTASSLADRSGWNELANENGFIVLYPQQRVWNNASKCFNWFRSKDLNDSTGETASIGQMLDHAIEHYPIDTGRVFAYGLSAGASMAVSVLANFPGKFKAGAVFAGGPYKVATNVFAAFPVMMNPPNRSREEWKSLVPPLEDPEGNYPRLLIFHGTDDNTVNIENAYSLVGQWTGIHGLDTEPDEILRPYKGHSFIERRAHLDSSGQERVAFYRLHGKGHELPVDPGKGEKKGGSTSSFVADMDFFSSYEVALRFGAIATR